MKKVAHQYLLHGAPEGKTITLNVDSFIQSYKLGIKANKLLESHS
ncbi:hypothetical protein [Serratia fonticola]|nr:hypothetical protein [Serratia fonticola]